MKIAIVYQYYQGHCAPGHSVVYDLTQHLAANGHKVTVITGETGYMKPDQPRLPWYRRLVRCERDGDVDVVRTLTYSQLHRSYFGRLLSFISFSVSCPIGLMKIDKPDVVLASSPPIFPIFTAWLVGSLQRIPFVLEVRDLWPASAVQMGILKNRQTIAIMSWMERKLYDGSKKIIALTSGIRDDICVRGWPGSKVEVITCGVDFDRLYPDPASGAVVREKYGWLGKKIILYFGALGEANNLPVTLRAAQKLQAQEDVLFVLIGDGMKRAEIERQVSELNLTNVLVLPSVPKEEARKFISAADLCLVTLRDIPLFDGAIPTKLIDYMACGKAVLCGVRGEAQRIVDEAGAGSVFQPDDENQLSEQVVSLLNEPDRAARMGAGGLAYVREHFSAPMLRQKVEALLVSVATEEHGSAAREQVG